MELLSEYVPLLLATGLLALYVWIPIRLLRKAGFSGIWVIPLIVTGYFTVIVLAFIEWPIERKLAWYRFKDGEQSDELVASVEHYAVDLEKEGDWEHACAVFEELRRRATADSATYYANCLKRLSDRMAEPA